MKYILVFLLFTSVTLADKPIVTESRSYPNELQKDTFTLVGGTEVVVSSAKVKVSEQPKVIVKPHNAYDALYDQAKRERRNILVCRGVSQEEVVRYQNLAATNGELFCVVPDDDERFPYGKCSRAPFNNDQYDQSGYKITIRKTVVAPKQSVIRQPTRTIRYYPAPTYYHGGGGFSGGACRGGG